MTDNVISVYNQRLNNTTLLERLEALREELELLHGMPVNRSDVVRIASGVLYNALESGEYQARYLKEGVQWTDGTYSN